VPDATDNCPEVANADQKDGDGDKVGDACDILPPGDAPVGRGRDGAGDRGQRRVFIKLPAGTKVPARAAKAYARAAQAAPISGFVPIKGVATVPIGSQIDSRKGQLDLKTASKYGSKGQRTNLQQGRFGAGMFRDPPGRAPTREVRQRQADHRSRAADPARPFASVRRGQRRATDQGASCAP